MGPHLACAFAIVGRRHEVCSWGLSGRTASCGGFRVRPHNGRLPTPVEHYRMFCFELVSAALLPPHVVTRRGEHPERWSWEIRRRSIPLGIKMIADGFQSEMAAQFAGKRALADFLDALLKEESCPRK
jgi:hypothetical protein